MTGGELAKQIRRARRNHQRHHGISCSEETPTVAPDFLFLLFCSHCCGIPFHLDRKDDPLLFRSAACFACCACLFLCLSAFLYCICSSVFTRNLCPFSILCMLARSCSHCHLCLIFCSMFSTCLLNDCLLPGKNAGSAHVAADKWSTLVWSAGSRKSRYSDGLRRPMRVGCVNAVEQLVACYTQ